MTYFAKLMKSYELARPIGCMVVMGTRLDLLVILNKLIANLNLKKLGMS